MNEITRIDLSILDFIAENLRNGFLDVILPAITHLGDKGGFWILLGLVLLIPKQTRKYGLTMMIALAIGALISNVTLKPLIARIRPYDLNVLAEVLVSKPHDFSFPSGHTTASFAAAAALWFSRKSNLEKFIKYLSWASMMLAVLIAFSRLYIYVHYPTDVLAGMIVGLFAGWLACKIVIR